LEERLMAKILSPTSRDRVRQLVSTKLKPAALIARLKSEGIQISAKSLSVYRQDAGLATKNRPVDWVDKETIRCRDCSGVFPMSDFNCGNESFASACKTCRSSVSRNTLQGSLRNVVNYARARSVAKSLAFDIDLLFIQQLWDEQAGLDFYTSEPMTFGLESRKVRGEKYGPSRSSVSIDQVRPGLGYTRSNVVLCCVATNAAKNNADIFLLTAIIRGMQRFETLNTKYALIQSARR
jgi:hypothetical protein